MRLLTLDDGFKLARILALSGARKAVRDSLISASKAGEEKRERLLALRAQADTATGAEQEALRLRYKTLAADESELTRIGVDAAMEIMECASVKGVSALVYDFLAGVMETDSAAVAAMPLPEVAGAIKEILKNNDVSSFFGLSGAEAATPDGWKNSSTGDMPTPIG